MSNIIRNIFTYIIILPTALILLWFGANNVVNSQSISTPKLAPNQNENLMLNGDFSDGDRLWFTSIGMDVDTSTGSLCATVPDDAVDPWLAIVSQGGLSLQAGQIYKLTFELRGNVVDMIDVLIGEDQHPWEKYYLTTAHLEITSQRYHYQFVMPITDNNSLLGFHIGGTPNNIYCIDNISLTLMQHSTTPTPTATSIPEGAASPLIFDDFAYNSDELNQQHDDTTNSVFGSNLWMMAEGEVESRFWRRFNWGDLEFDDDVALEASTAGMDFLAKAGHELGTNGPVIFSGIAFPNRGVGTYHARIRLDDLQDDLQVMQSFWAYALNQYGFVDDSYDTNQNNANYMPNSGAIYYASEADIEWHNWFNGDNVSRLAVSNHRGSNPSFGGVVAESATLQCLYRDTAGETTHFRDCVGTVENTLLMPNQWVNAMYVIDDASETVSYSLWIDNWNDLGGALWVGGPVDNPQWGEPLTISRYFPTSPMIAAFSQHFSERQGFGVQELSQDHALGIDYFYYSPRTDLTREAIQADIERLREEGLVRVNTTGLAFQEDRTFSLSIEGPETFKFNQLGTWSAVGSLTGTRFDVHYRYRQHNEQGWSVWHNASNPDLVFVPDGSFDKIELTATAWNYWNKAQVDTDSRIIEAVALNEKLWLPMVMW
ncbi:MAG: hypothetical protein AAF702_05095 [Chloroflexota bacterium]